MNWSSIFSADKGTLIRGESDKCIAYVCPNLTSAGYEMVVYDESSGALTAHNVAADSLAALLKIAEEWKVSIEPEDAR